MVHLSSEGREGKREGTSAYVTGQRQVSVEGIQLRCRYRCRGGQGDEWVKGNRVSSRRLEGASGREREDTKLTSRGRGREQ